MTQRDITPNLKQFSALFLKWNRSINLSAARTEPDLAEHIDDSLALVDHLTGSRRHLDVGSGGGFPVVVAAIACPQIQFTALEPVHKKQAFLRTAARELGLSNLDALAIRLDDHDVRDYDSASSRATFDLADWLRQGLAFVRPGGTVLGFEGIPRDDLPATVERFPYELEGKTRAIVALRKPTG